MYRDALKNSSFKEEFWYREVNIPHYINKEKIRSMIIKIEKEERKIIWFNPPFLLTS